MLFKEKEVRINFLRTGCLVIMIIWGRSSNTVICAEVGNVRSNDSSENETVIEVAEVDKQLYDSKGEYNESRRGRWKNRGYGHRSHGYLHQKVHGKRHHGFGAGGLMSILLGKDRLGGFGGPWFGMHGGWRGRLQKYGRHYGQRHQGGDHGGRTHHKDQRGSRDSKLAKEIRTAMVGNIGRLMVLRSELNIIDEQKTKIRETIKDHHKNFGAMRKNIAESRRALRQSVTSGDDEEVIRKAADEVGKAIGHFAIQQSRLRKDVRSVLTQEQRNKVDEVREANLRTRTVVHEKIKKSIQEHRSRKTDEGKIAE